MRPIITWFVYNPVAANLLMAILVIGGLMTIPTLRQEEFPEIDLETIQITVPYLGGAPEEVEEGVCIRIEEALEGTENLRHMNVNASEGSCSISLELVSGTDGIQALNDIKSKVDGINTLPAQTERPIISQLTMRQEVMEIAISGDTDERTLKTVAEQLREDIAAIPGISQVDVGYVRPDEISVEISEQTLRRYGLTLEQVANAVRRSSLDLPGGSIKARGGEILVRTTGQAYKGEEFEDIIVVTRTDGTAITLGEIAQVVDGFQEGDLQVRFDSQPAAMVTVYRIGTEDTVKIANKVQAYLEQARSQITEGIELTVWVNSSDELRARIGKLLGTAGGGFILVLITLAIPLQFRLAMWVAAGIPIALLGAIMMFPAAGITISSLSVMGFILVLGIVVDDAIVVGERVYAHERHAEDQYTAAINGTCEVAVPVIFGVLTTIAAFIPVIAVPGRMGEFFSVMGFVVVICLLFSIIESQMILPSHLAHRSTKRDTKKQLRLFTKWQNFQEKVSSSLEHFAIHNYGRLLKLALEWRYLTVSIGIALLCLVMAMVMSGRIRFQFFPAIEGDNVYASLSMPEGIPVEETMLAAARIERAAEKLAAELDAASVDGSSGIIQHVLTSVGQGITRGGPPGMGGGATASHQAEVSMALVPMSERDGISSRYLADRWRELTGMIPDAVELSFSADQMSAGDAISIQLRGRDVDELGAVAAELKAELGRFDGVIDIADTFRSGKQEIKLKLRPEARHLGLTLNDLAMQVRSAFYGEEVQRVQRGTEDIRVMVRFPESDRRSLGDLEDMRIRTANGTEVPFAAVAEATLGRGYSTIRRIDRQRVVTVSADVKRDIASPEAIISSLRSETLPLILSKYRGVSYTLGGEQEARMEGLGGLLRLFPLSLLIIYALLAIPLKSYLQPLVIMSIIPFGAVGAMMGHYIMGWQLVMPSILGIVALSGVVINSSLVLVDYINRRRLAGVVVQKAVEAAGIVRFRPILITSITTFVGLLPLMLSREPATAFMVPLAISLAFGVVFATFITLFQIPSLYLILEDFFPGNFIHIERPEANISASQTGDTSGSPDPVNRTVL